MHCTSTARLCAFCHQSFFPCKPQSLFCSHRCWHQERHRRALVNFHDYLWARIHVCPHGPCLYCCWEWQGPFHAHGYGLASRGRAQRQGLAHRMVYMLHHECTLLSNTHVLHHCDNPPCCNPNHLFTGNQQLNVQDMVRKGRQQKGETAHHAKLTTAQVNTIRSLLAEGYLQRVIAAQFCVSRSTIGDIKHGRSRRLG